MGNVNAQAFAAGAVFWYNTSGIGGVFISIMLAAVWILAAVFILNSITATLCSNFNAGTLLLWCISAMLVLYGVFNRQIDAFCASGVGLVLKWLFVAGVAVYAALTLFIAVAGGGDRSTGAERAVIVLGAGIRGTRVSNLLRRRLETALAVYRKNPAAAVVVTGGQGPQEHVPEGVAMRGWMLAHGVPGSDVILEDKSRTTEENLLFARELLAARGIGTDAPVAVVTSQFHCFRARKLAKRAGYTSVASVAAPAGPWSVLPCYLREVLALMKFWLVSCGRHNILK